MEWSQNKGLWLSNEFSLVVPKKIYGEEYGEYTEWF